MPEYHKMCPFTGSVVVFGQFKGLNTEVPDAICLVIELSLDIKIKAINMGQINLNV